MIDVAGVRERRDHDQWDAWPIAEEINRLRVPRIVVAAGLIEDDDDGGLFPQLRIGLRSINDLSNEGLSQRRGRGARMAIDQPVGLDEGDSRKRRVLRRVRQVPKDVCVNRSDEQSDRTT